MSTATVARRLLRRRLRECLTLQPLLESGKPRVDRDRGIIYGVRIIGTESENKRFYKPSAIKEALRLYEKRAVNTDHPAKPGDSRSVLAVTAWLEDVQTDPDGGARGDLHLLDPKDPFSVKLMNAAEQAPHLFGLSHNAEGEGYTDDRGVFVVEHITRVHSVDLVTDPATTRGLFERRTMKLTLRQLLEIAVKKLPAKHRRARAGLKKLLEAGADDGDQMALMDDEMTGDAAPDAAAADGKDWRQCLIDCLAELHKANDPEAHELAGKVQKLLKPAGAGDDLEEAEGDSPDAGSEKDPKDDEDDLEEARNAMGGGFNNNKEQKGAMAAAREEGRLDDYESVHPRNRRKLSPTARALQERVDKLEADKREAELKTWLREACETRKLTWTVALQESLLPLGDRKAIGKLLDQMKAIAATQGRGLPRSQGQPAQRALVEGLEKAPTTAKEFADGLHALAGSRW